MAETSLSSWRNLRVLARPLLLLTWTVQLLHVAVLWYIPQPAEMSNLLQLVLPLVILGISVHQAFSSATRVERLCWRAASIAFGIWSAAQAIFLLLLRRPLGPGWTVRPDDALWVIFGLPFLLLLTVSNDSRDKALWLDRMQPLLITAALYCLVFLPSSRLDVSKAYLVQNCGLLLCCMLRLPSCALVRERRFFLRLAAFLLAYTVSEKFAEYQYAHGADLGSWVDLAWTIPFTLYITLVLRDVMASDSEDAGAIRIIRAAGALQGLSVAGLAFLSIGLASLLATNHLLLGGSIVVIAFACFALRTNIRELLWRQTHMQLEETVLRDALTGLGNRLLLRSQLKLRLEGHGQRPVALLFADLDRFKQINDSVGHGLGDQILIEVGRRLRAAALPDSTVCRLGGDEFIVLSTVTSTGDAQRAGEALLAALQLPFRVGPHELHCSASIGVVLARAGEAPDDLLRIADHAMYRAKHLGRDRVQLFDADLREQMQHRWTLETELKACIAARSIDVAFQPILSITEGTICGFEALARWNHPALGSVSPAEFVPLAEETGLIGPLGAHVLEVACRQMASWNRRWSASFSVSVNLSARQLADPALLPHLLATLEETELGPQLLRLEITETALLTNEIAVRQTLCDIREHGVRISLDDFGTGYSSLSFLLSLPVDEVKVDRSFVSHMHRDPNREELVRTVIHLGHSLGKRVVAEGVESEQDLLGLAAMGCECAQGYFISQPLLPGAVESAVQRPQDTGLQNYLQPQMRNAPRAEVVEPAGGFAAASVTAV